ncbi:MAG: hypothetical protein LBC87_12550 [Fibromonadaceae bacterium]|nr:hypothetical protein [Fibromonadaceae bacterium]
MSKTKKTFIYRAFISMLCVLASCSSDDSGSNDKHSSPSTATVSLGCTGLQRNVAKGGTIEIPDLECNNGRTATDEIWYGIPDGNWEVDPNTNATSYVISVTATCGSVELLDVPCGKVNVTAAAGGSSSSRGGSSSSGTAVTLTCTGLKQSVAKGGTIAMPTLTCSNDVYASEETWTGLGSGGWIVNTNTSATSYTISVSANCGSVRKTGVSCGTIAVTEAGSSSSTGGGSSSSRGSSSSAGSSSSWDRIITCTFSKGTYAVGEDVLAPAIKCFEADGITPYTTSEPGRGNANFTVASGGGSLANPTAWRTASGVTTFNTPGTRTIAVSNVTCGSHQQRAATCTPSLNITAPTYMLTCVDVASSGTAGISIPKPAVTCTGSNGTTSTPVATSLTWNSTPTLNWDTPTAGQYTGVTVSTTAGDCASKTATCGGTLTVGAAPVTYTLSCGDVPTTGTVGTEITPPTVTCTGSDGTTSNVTTGLVWADAPTWANPVEATTYSTIKVTTTAGNCAGKPAASCGGTLTVGAAPVTYTLSCGAVPATGTVGTPITPPTVTCTGSDGTTSNVTTGLVWADAPTWATPEEGSYSAIKVSTNTTAGNCASKSAVPCSGGPLVVAPTSSGD